MKTLKTLFTLALLSTITVSQAQWWGGKGVKGNGDVITITRSTGDYDNIKCGGSMDFKLIEGKEGQITIKGESNLLEYIVTEVKNGTLVVKVRNGKNINPSNNKPLIITIPYQDIDGVSLSGSGDVWNEGIIKSKDFSTAVAGSGDLILNINTNYLVANVDGSGDLNLKGRATKLKVRVDGSGDINAFKLDSKNVEASITGSGDIGVNCSGELKARIVGSGDIEYRGKPTSEDTKVIGSGSIEN